ncbi:hypothetical protein ACFLVJ_00785 [Chloroflexota bacterium]
MTSVLLMQFSNLVTRAGTVAQIGGDSASNLGFIVLGIIVGPVLVLAIVGVIEFPKRSRVPELFLGSFLLLVSALVLSFAAVGALLKFIVPQ